MAEDPVETTIMDGYNCVSIKGKYKKFANFVYKVESHAIDVETQSKKYLLECTTIADAQTFTIILARDDLKSYLKFCKIFDEQKPDHIDSWYHQTRLNTGNICTHILSHMDRYESTGLKKRYWLVDQPRYFKDEGQDKEFFILEGGQGGKYLLFLSSRSVK